MALKKFSQIAAAGGAPALTDTLIGVGSGTTDLQYTLTQLQSVAFAFSGLGATNINSGLTVKNAGTTTVFLAGITPATGVYYRFASSDFDMSYYDTFAHAIAAGSTGRGTYVVGGSSAKVATNGILQVVAAGVDPAGTTGAFLSCGGTATWQLGAANAASPVAQTLQVQSVVAGTTDTAGTDWTRRASLSTGTAAGGNIVEQTGFSAKSTGSSQGTLVERRVIVAKGKVLTSTVAASLFDVALPTLTMAGGCIRATIVCTNGTDMQSYSQIINFAAVNKGAAYTTTITADAGNDAKAVSAGTLTAAWSILNGTNKVTIQLTATTSLTPSTNAFLVYYQIENNSEQAITVL